jgi:hypothetical protein
MYFFRFLSLKDIRVKAKWKVQKWSGGKLADLITTAGTEDKVAILNAPGMSMFDDVVVAFQHQEISRAQMDYPLKSSIITTFGTAEEQKLAELSLALWFEDSPGVLDAVPPDQDLNRGGYARYMAIRGSSTITTISPIIADPLMTNRPLVDGVSVSITFTPSTPKRLFHKEAAATADPRLVIEDMTLLLKWIRPKASLLRQPAPVYPLIVHKLLKIEHPKGLSIFGSRCINSFGVIPRRATVWLMDEERYSGSLTKNHLSMEHLGIKDIGVGINGVVEWRNMAFENPKNYTEAYYGLFTSGIHSAHCPVTYAGYGNGGYVSKCCSKYCSFLYCTDYLGNSPIRSDSPRCGHV